MSIDNLSLNFSLFLFCISSLLIVFGGIKLTKKAETIALITGLGELLTGAILIGAITSLAGLVTSISAAHQGFGSLAVSNSIGGIAAQTVFLAVADMTYRKANLEHAAASEANLLQGVLLIIMLALPLLAMAKPEWVILQLHPVSFLLFFAYVFGLILVARAKDKPMWRPIVTPETQTEEGQDLNSKNKGSQLNTWISFCLLAALVAVSGWILAQSAIAISEHSNIEETLIGGILTAITTSLPELVIAIAAVRRGALGLAVGNILGGNAFDVLFLAAADIAYREGTIYSVMGFNEIYWIALSIILVATLLLGLLRREKHGIGNIGFESTLMFILYFLGVTILVV